MLSEDEQEAQPLPCGLDELFCPAAKLADALWVLEEYRRLGWVWAALAVLAKLREDVVNGADPASSARLGVLRSWLARAEAHELFHGKGSCLRWDDPGVRQQIERINEIYALCERPDLMLTASTRPRLPARLRARVARLLKGRCHVQVRGPASASGPA